MIVRFTRVSAQQHLFAYRRDDGGGEQRLLETRSLLYHDLLHYAVESEGALTHGFYGQLAGGRTLDALTIGGGVAADGLEAQAVELVVGALTGAFKTAQSDAEIAVGVRGYCTEIGHDAPEWVTPAFIAGVRARLRALEGRWRATPFGETMELGWPAPA
jgi:hypothetical protein